LWWGRHDEDGLLEWGRGDASKIEWGILLKVRGIMGYEDSEEMRDSKYRLVDMSKTISLVI
jgi:hypothetical protein